LSELLTTVPMSIEKRQLVTSNDLNSVSSIVDDPYKMGVFRKESDSKSLELYKGSYPDSDVA
jgi:hypothetical protein